MKNCTKTSLKTRRRGGQRGAYAMEYALVFPFFFLAIYGALAFSMVLFMRIDLQHAAEEGARASLRYQTTAGARLQQAVNVATTNTAWMPGPRTVVADICGPGATPGVTCATSTPATPVAVCGDTLAMACQIVVIASYNYAANPVFPALPGLGFLMPSVLQANASVLVDAKTMSP